MIAYRWRGDFKTKKWSKFKLELNFTAKICKEYKVNKVKDDKIHLAKCKGHFELFMFHSSWPKTRINKVIASRQILPLTFQEILKFRKFRWIIL